MACRRYRAVDVGGVLLHTRDRGRINGRGVDTKQRREEEGRAGGVWADVLGADGYTRRQPQYGSLPANQSRNKHHSIVAWQRLKLHAFSILCNYLYMLQKRNITHKSTT